MVPSISSSNSIQHVSPNVVTPETGNVEAQPAAAHVPPPAGANTNAHPVTPPPADANTEQPVALVPPPATTKRSRRGRCLGGHNLDRRMIPVSRH